jgi:hypothetical protein
MAKQLLLLVWGSLLVGIVVPTHAGDRLQRLHLSQAATTLVGTWRSGNFQYTFQPNGAYVYVGVMGTAAMKTQISEEGTYAVSGDTLIVSRQRGIITNTNNYRQPLKPQTTTFRWRWANTPQGMAIQLTFPTGGDQLFYRQ